MFPVLGASAFVDYTLHCPFDITVHLIELEFIVVVPFFHICQKLFETLFQHCDFITVCKGQIHMHLLDEDYRVANLVMPIFQFLSLGA
jgi:hypothetical protein